MRSCERKRPPAQQSQLKVSFARPLTSSARPWPTAKHSAAIAAVVTKAKLAGLWIERRENTNTNFNTKVIDRRNIPVTELSDEELLAIAAGALPEREEMKVLLLPPGPKSKP